MDASDLKEVPAFFTKTGNDIWKLESYCMQPTAKMRNLEDGRIEDFGMGGAMAQVFHKIEMPIKAKEKE